MRTVFSILLMQGICNIVGILFGLGYVRLSVYPAIDEATRLLLAQWSIGATVLSFGIFTPILFAVVYPVGKLLHATASGAAPRANEEWRALRRALDLPILCTRISTFSWFTAGASLPLFFDQKLPETGHLFLFHGIFTILLIGCVASIFVYYLAEWWSRRAILPVLFPQGRLSRVPGATPVTLGFKLLMLVLTNCVLPIIVLTFTAWSGLADESTVLFLGISFVVFGALQGVLIAGSVSRPLRKLAAEMRRVQNQDLNAHAPVMSLDDTGQVAEGFNEMVAGLRQAAFVKDTFGRYVTRQVLDEILSGKISLGGELREATVLFCDIRGFTSFSESLDPKEVVAFLNEFLDIMVNVIFEYGGTIDKFMGDAIMASFGVPVRHADDSLRAVQAAWAMLEKLGDWNRVRASDGKTEVTIGIGLHTGMVVAGNIGSSRKMEYTIIGDTVNTASRIEQLNKTLGTRLLISEQTYEMVRAHVSARRLEPIEVKGKSRALVVYEMIGLADPVAVPL